MKKNAKCTAGCLESMRLIQSSVDHDCNKDKRSSHRASPKEMEAVEQITSDLLKVEASHKQEGRAGYPSFPKFERNILKKLDFRDLHKWMKEHLQLWGSIYQDKD